MLSYLFHTILNASIGRAIKHTAIMGTILQGLGHVCISCMQNH